MPDASLGGRDPYGACRVIAPKHCPTCGDHFPMTVGTHCHCGTVLIVAPKEMYDEYRRRSDAWQPPDPVAGSQGAPRSNT